MFAPPAVEEPLFTPGEDVVSIDCILVRFANYVNKRTGKYEPNWLMRCSTHKNCTKRRGATQDFEKHHGLVEPLAFLHCWHAVVWPTKPTKLTHAQENPTQESVDLFVLEHADELKEVCRRAGR